MARYLDITGQRYGRLVVIEYVGTDKNRQARWLCQCDCGNTKIIAVNSLRRGLTQSCGCLNDEVRRSGKNQSGKREGKALENIRVAAASRPPNPYPEAMIRSNIGRPKSEETKRKISEAQKGKPRNPESIRKGAEARTGKHYKRKKKRVWSDEWRLKRSEVAKEQAHLCPFYIDGKSAERHDERKIAYTTVEYKIWRDSVFRRDDFTCQICGVRGARIQADHIKPWSTHSGLRYDISNGRTLCEPCHRKTPTYARKLKK